MSMIAEKGEFGFAPPGGTLTRIMGCCSAGLIMGVYSNGSKIQKPSNVVRVPEGTTLDTDDQKIAAMIAYGMNIFTREAANTLFDWLLMWRVENSAHPYQEFDAFKYRKSSMTKEPGRYFWPSKSWVMFDRTDLKYTDSAFKTMHYGNHLEALPEDSGITVSTFDQESVHALGSSYTSFGSEKPNGYGTIRNWSVGVDAEKFRTYLQPMLDNLIESVEFEVEDGKSKANSPRWV